MTDLIKIALLSSALVLAGSATAADQGTDGNKAQAQQEQQQTPSSPKKYKSADELEKELGLDMWS